MLFPLQLLKKQKAGRLQNIKTFKTFCKENKKFIPTAWLKVSKTIKLPESNVIFGHVAIGQLNSNQVVVKVYKEKDNMLQVELAILKTLKQNKIQNIINVICHFGCSHENQLIWNDNISQVRPICSSPVGANDKLHFVIFEYIRFGNIDEYFSKNSLQNNIYIVFVKQSIFCLLEIYDRFKIHHGDIHGVNIMIDFDDPKVNEYTICDKVFKINTLGCEPVFIDFGRANRSSSSSSSRKSKSSYSNTQNQISLPNIDDINWGIQEVLIMLHTMETLVKDEQQKKWTQMVYDNIQNFNKHQTKDCIEYVAGL
jgi:serine/threonine protein kinase